MRTKVSLPDASVFFGGETKGQGGTVPEEAPPAPAEAGPETVERVDSETVKPSKSFKGKPAHGNTVLQQRSQGTAPTREQPRPSRVKSTTPTLPAREAAGGRDESAQGEGGAGREKVTIYVSPETLFRIERLRLDLIAEFGGNPRAARVNRQRIARAALEMALQEPDRLTDYLLQSE